MKLKIYLSTQFAVLLLLTSCSSAVSNREPVKGAQLKGDFVFVEKKSPTEKETKNALQFINNYVENCNKMNEALGTAEFVNASNLVTKRFKSELKRILKEAWKENLEIGLDADPIFDAQDYPEKGFEVESFGKNKLVVKGIDWSDFKLTIIIAEENGKWLVDGCGIVNVPRDQRSER